MSNRSFKVTVCFESREGGGLRAWSPDVSGFVLSHSNVDALLADVTPALKRILEFRFRTSIAVDRLESLREVLEETGVVGQRPLTGPQEYVAYCP